jgi:hypothetical protein
MDYVVLCHNCGKEYPFASKLVGISKQPCHKCGKIINVDNPNVRYYVFNKDSVDKFEYDEGVHTYKNNHTLNLIIILSFFLVLAAMLLIKG